MKKSILMVGLDVTLAEARIDYLNRHYDTMAVPPIEALDWLRREHFDLLLVCHTTPEDEASGLIQIANEEFPQVCIVHLRIMTQHITRIPTVHRLVTVNYNPDGWRKAVDDLLAPNPYVPCEHHTKPPGISSSLAS